MSYTNEAPTDCLYSYHAQSTQLNTFTTEDNLQKTYPAVQIPAYQLDTAASRSSSSLRVKAWGRLGTTGSPTFTWSLRMLTTETWSAGGILLGSTAATTAGATVTLAPWTLEVEIGLKTLSIAGASTLRTMGEVRGPSALASPFSSTIPANNTTMEVATFDSASVQYLFLSVACGTSNALNLIQLEQLKVYADN